MASSTPLQFSKPLIVLGAGPVGLLAAIRGRQLGLDVDVYASGLPQGPPRVECVPSQVVALLVEFGVSPKRVGVDTLYQERTAQWSSRAVVTTPTPDVAHIERPALDIALLRAALQAGAKVHAMQDGLLQQFLRQHRENQCLLLDASGRSAVTATQRIGPSRPLVARLFHLPMRPALRSSGLMIAAGRDGYAYRLGSATTLTVGVVGRKDFVRGDGRQLIAKIADYAPWLVEGIAGDEMQPGASGPASVQWSVSAHEESVPIGDAFFARDALASQGLAMGFSDALKAVAQPDQKLRPSRLTDQKQAISLHCQRVIEQIAGSTFNSAPSWVEYARFLADLEPAAMPSHAGLSPAQAG
jgi:hypothetical protein